LLLCNPITVTTNIELDFFRRKISRGMLRLFPLRKLSFLCRRLRTSCSQNVCRQWESRFSLRCFLFSFLFRFDLYYVINLSVIPFLDVYIYL
jgi:hypothetical protein